MSQMALANKILPRKSAKACANAPKQGGCGLWVFQHIPKWIMDTGSGVDLVSHNHVKHAIKHFEKPQVPIDFATANGFTTAKNVCRASMPPLREIILPYVLSDTPAVLSVGLRCMKFGYSMHWFPHQLPFLVTPENEVIKLDVSGDLPYLSLKAKAMKGGTIPKSYPGCKNHKPTGEVKRQSVYGNAFRKVSKWIVDSGSGPASEGRHCQ